MARILITSFGSYGDLFPYVALGKALQNRSHEVTLGTAAIFKDKVEAEGLPFCHIRCSLDQYTTPESIRAFLQQVFDPLKGGEFITREMMQGIEETYQDTRRAAQHADFVISNPLAYTTPIVCKELRLPWLSTVLAPMFFLSVYDPPIISFAPWLRSLNKFSPALYRSIFRLIKKLTISWTKPLYDLCAMHQLPAPAANPLFEGQYSPHGTLAMFSTGLAEPQPDWPINTMVTGFPLFSGEEADAETLLQLDNFLQAGDPPLVFALGSSAVHIAQDFFQTSARIARKLNRRALLVTGPMADVISKIEAGNDLLAVKYVAYDKLFPHASVIIHQAGIGTLAHAICAKKPMLIVPFGFDQFDNAERLMRLGVAEVIKRNEYTVEKAAPLIERLAMDESYKQRASKIGTSMQRENGIENACNSIESILNRQDAGEHQHRLC